MSADFSEVEALSGSLAGVGGRLPAMARAATSKGALNIKTDTRANISGHPSWKRLPQSVNYDMTGNAFFSQAEIGYDDVGQGELAGIYEYGSARHAPNPTLIPAFKRETPRFEQALLTAAAKLIEDAL